MYGKFESGIILKFLDVKTLIYFEIHILIYFLTFIILKIISRKNDLLFSNYFSRHNETFFKTAPALLRQGILKGEGSLYY